MAWQSESTADAAAGPRWGHLTSARSCVGVLTHKQTNMGLSNNPRLECTRNRSSAVGWHQDIASTHCHGAPVTLLSPRPRALVRRGARQQRESGDSHHTGRAAARSGLEAVADEVELGRVKHCERTPQNASPKSHHSSDMSSAVRLDGARRALGPTAPRSVHLLRCLLLWCTGVVLAVDRGVSLLVTANLGSNGATVRRHVSSAVSVLVSTHEDVRAGSSKVRAHGSAWGQGLSC